MVGEWGVWGVCVGGGGTRKIKICEIFVTLTRGIGEGGKKYGPIWGKYL
jgi:hypothetical protein